MQIKVDDLSGAQIRALLAEHLQHMASLSPAESMHALDLEGLRQPGVTFWSVWDGTELLGCGALKQLDDAHAEVKSMRTAKAHQRRGVARVMVEHIVAEATRRGYRRLSLETGTTPEFEPAHRLYQSMGFTDCEPFADYVVDPYSRYMTRVL